MKIIRRWLRRLDGILVVKISYRVGSMLALIGGVLAIIGGMLPWTSSPSFGGDLTWTLNPAELQWFGIALGILTTVFIAVQFPIVKRVLGWMAPAGGGDAAKAASVGVLALAIAVTVRAALKLGGLVNVSSGLWLTLIGGVIAVVGSRTLPARQPVPEGRELPAIIEILLISLAIAAMLYTAVIGLDTNDEDSFIGFLIMACFAAVAISRSGLVLRVRSLTQRHYAVSIGAGLAAAFIFPLTQGTSQLYMNIAVNTAVFAVTAIGLNIVVGLAGLLDLGYIAFTGVGAYSAALLSGSTASVVYQHTNRIPPFLLVLIAGAVFAAVFGVIIGAPTLRLRGDYLAIVTLGFGEIFRITVNNLNGTAGPNITNGPNGIYGIPALNIFGWDFGKDMSLGPFHLTYFANYYYLLIVLIMFTILVFSRTDRSRIGRAWVSIREDETAAAAMGVNTFKLKLLAFAMGAFLAGMAGTVQAHILTSVTPDTYVFLKSAYLLAAIVLGGLGTISGALLGAFLLNVTPEKLRFFQDYRLWLFGLTVILMMRFRPEGIIPNARRAREFHERHETNVGAEGGDAMAAPPGSRSAEPIPTGDL
jgi:branched-chain amino acid transport system permease protein